MIVAFRLMKTCCRCGRNLYLDDYFRKSKGSADGRQSSCKDCDYQRRLAYPFKRYPNGDRHKQTIRMRLNRAVERGLLERADHLDCTDCGGPARYYDHHLGYADEHALDVQPVCSRCDGLRRRRRGENAVGEKAEKERRR